MKSNIETYLRLKPLLQNEIKHYNNNYQDSFISNDNDINNDLSFGPIEYEINNNGFINIHVPEQMRKGYVNNMKKCYDFKFNDIFEQNSTQEEVFEKIGNKVISNSLEGYNSTVFCYGQTGSGKTYTMCGSKNWKERGLIPRLLVELFKRIREIKNYSYEIFISYRHRFAAKIEFTDAITCG